MPKSSQTGNRQEQDQQSQIAARSLKVPQQSRETSRELRLTSLVVGDALCFLIFASLGANRHGEGFNLGYNIQVAVPFMAAWFLISPFAGAFRADVVTKPSKMVLRTLLSWLTTWPVAMGLRWLLVDRVKVPPTAFNSFLSFALVALVFNMGLLLLWRWPFALLNNNLRKRGI